MARKDKYGIRELKRDFPNDEACLNFIFDALHKRECSCGGRYSPVKGRRQFQCSKCRSQIAPAAGTIFHKSDTPLTLWFHALFVFSNTKSGISAKQMERELNATYKTAWRMLMLIRKSLAQDEMLLKGDVEIDEMYFGGRKRAGKDNEYLSEAILEKSVVTGTVERGGKIKSEVSPSRGSFALGQFLTKNVAATGTRLFTDESNRYNRIARGYERHSVNHSQKEYMRGEAHINTIESFWSRVKRSITGTHRVISKKYLQLYLDGFVWHRNNRHNDNLRFSSLLGALLTASK